MNTTWSCASAQLCEQGREALLPEIVINYNRVLRTIEKREVEEIKVVNLQERNVDIMSILVGNLQEKTHKFT